MFKKGDKVRVLPEQGTMSLEEGSVYTVSHVYSDGANANYVCLELPEGRYTGGYFDWRFELVEEPEVPDLTPQEVASSAFKDTNPKDGAATSRLDLSLVPTTAIAHEALAFTEGHLKYGGYNWRDAGVLASVYYAAANRHMMKWFNGEECDPKTGVHHLGSARACLAVLLDAMECGELKDDRPPAVDMGELLNEFEEKVKKLQALFPNGPKRHTEAAR